MLSELYIEQVKADLKDMSDATKGEEGIILLEALAVLSVLQETYREVREKEAKEKASEATEAKDKLVCLDLSDLAWESLSDMSETFIKCCSKYSNISSFASHGSIADCPEKIFTVRLKRLPRTQLRISIKTEISQRS